MTDLFRRLFQIGRWPRSPKPPALAPEVDNAAAPVIECATHGASDATYVCQHLIADPRQTWFCAHPSADNRWPDAWCSVCDIEYMKEGEWNEANEQASDIKLICTQCYETKRAESVLALSDDQLGRWDALIAECHRKLEAKQSALWQEFQLGNYERWDWEQETGELVFSHQGVPKVVAKIEFIGSVSTHSNTWLWAWANFGLLESVRTRVCEVRDFGDAQGYPKLVVPKWPADEIDGWEMAGVAAEVLGARGVYRTPGDSGFTFMAIMTARWA